MNGAHVCDEPAEALACAREVLASTLPEAVEYLPGAVVVFASQGRVDECRLAVDRLQELAPNSVMAVWCAAVNAATFFEPSEAGDLVHKAVLVAPEVAEALSGIEQTPWAWFHRREGYDDLRDQLDHVACMLASTFRAADPQLTSLAALESGQKRGPAPTLH